MNRPYPRLRITKGTCGGWHVAGLNGPDSGPSPVCHHASWAGAMQCAGQTSMLLGALAPFRRVVR